MHLLFLVINARTPAFWPNQPCPVQLVLFLEKQNIVILKSVIFYIITWRFSNYMFRIFGYLKDNDVIENGHWPWTKDAVMNVGATPSFVLLQGNIF